MHVISIVCTNQIEATLDIQCLFILTCTSIAHAVEFPFPGTQGGRRHDERTEGLGCSFYCIMQNDHGYIPDR